MKAAQKLNANCHGERPSGPDHYPRSGGRALLRALTDCPKCKYGTVDRRVIREEVWMVCADCGQHWPLALWQSAHPK